MAALRGLESHQPSTHLNLLNPLEAHTFLTPSKRINEGHDVPTFLMTKAYRDIGIFIMQLNVAMCPRKGPGSAKATTWLLDSTYELCEPVQELQELLGKISSIIDEAPPDTGPRRFGNVSFRKWYEILEARVEELLQTYLPRKVLDFPLTELSKTVLEELTPYLLGGFGSAQRLDYGTGHELSFIAFLGCLWKLGAFSGTENHDGSLERQLVIGVIEPYLRVIRRLILTYTLEPAGSHGVWGLDDHSFVSYIFGSSQYCPPINANEAMPVEGALSGSPKPGDVAKKVVVDRERQHNMYFSAIGFINDVKTGPFWEHSPILFDISGVRSGWGKINKGMIKMYNAEVLSKFPVVQHFPFGSLFSWEQDPKAAPVSASVHTSNQPIRPDPLESRNGVQESTKAPWATGGSAAQTVSTQAPWARISAQPTQMAPPTRAPWASQPGGELISRSVDPRGPPDVVTAAPWAKKQDTRDLRGP